MAARNLAAPAPPPPGAIPLALSAEEVGVVYAAGRDPIAASARRALAQLELLLDYEDFLRHRHLAQWTSDEAKALAVRQVPRKSKKDSSNLTDLTDQERWALYAPWLEHADPAVRANATICLIHQANYLLDQQIAALERAFIKDGGYSEQLAAARLAERQRNKHQPDPFNPPDHIPACPKCGKPMVLRTARTGKNAGQQFWGCSAYPDCKGVVKL